MEEKMIHIIHGRMLGPTARELAEKFNQNDMNALTLREGRGQTERPDYILPWGWGGKVRFLPRVKWLGSRAAIALNSDKVGSLHVMRENEITVPDFGRLAEGMPPDLPIYLRTRGHMAGRGLLYVDSHEALREHHRDYHYWIKAITGNRVEYRIHADGDGNVLLRQRKFYAGTGEPDGLVRNMRNGWNFSVQDTVRGIVVKEGRLAVKALGLAVGAADVILKGDTAYVIEVNSAPSLRFHATLDAYFNKFLEIINETEENM
jgi:hypothetical protein